MKTPSTMAEHVAHTVRDFHQQQTGRAPQSVTVIFSEGMLAITMREALTPAEKKQCRTAEGCAEVRDSHRRRLQSNVGALGREIVRITGVPVREAAAEIETVTGTVVHLFTTGSMVQVFHLAGGLSAEFWSESEGEPTKSAGM